MTNEEKALEIGTDNALKYWFGKDEQDEKIISSVQSALEMAEWKDQQFKDILKQKLAEYHKKCETSIELDENLLWGGKEDVIGLLLLELFEEKD